MSELYTSLSRMKQAMGGQLPPMTPLTEAAKAVVDPDFTIGMGALEEHEDRGLRCPVKGCGKYFHRLKQHINQKHPDVGGSKAVQRLLDIPRKVALTSNAEALRMKQHRVGRPIPRSTLVHSKANTRKSHTVRSENLRSMNGRNARNLCEAQVQARFEELERLLGHSPSIREACQLGHQPFVVAVSELYGSWNAAKAQFGLAMRTPIDQRKLTDRNAIMRSMQAYFDAHGDLPSSTEMQQPTRTPLTQSLGTIYRVLGSSSWLSCAKEIATTLGVHSGRYSKAREPAGIVVPAGIALTIVPKNGVAAA